jgi:hypothetical protein
VPPPEIHGTKYKDIVEKNSVENFDLSDMPLHQRNKAAARKMCSANMSRETTTKKIEEYIATIDDKGTKKAFERW